MDRELTIRMKLDKGPAESSSKAFHQGESARIDATVEKVKLSERVKATAAGSSSQARVSAAVKAGQAEVAVAGEVKRAIVGAAEAGASAMAGMHDKGVKGFTGMGIASGLAQAGVQKLIEMFGMLGRAIDETTEKRKAWASAFSAQRDDLTELSVLMGKPLDDKFTADFTSFNQKTMMRPAEGKDFLTELYNSGAQYKGSNISDKEFDQYAEQAGALATAKGLSRAQAGNLAGTVLGFQDYSKFGDQASEVALGKVHSGIAISQHGKGDAAVLANQFSMLTSASLNEDSLKGTFQDSDEAAMVISIAAEKHDAQAAELTKMAGRALRGFGAKDKQSPLLKKAGVNAKTGFVKSLEQIAPIVEAEAKRRNIAVEDVLRENFSEEGAVDAIGVFLNKGVFGGGFNERRAFAKTVAGPKPALESINTFRASKTGIRRTDEAERAAVEMKRGRENDDLEAVRYQAVTEMIKNKELDNADAKLAEYLADTATFGALGKMNQRAIDQKVWAKLGQRTPKGAVSAKDNAGETVLTPERMEEKLNQRITSIRKAGGDPLREPGRDALPEGMVPLARIPDDVPPPAVPKPVVPGPQANLAPTDLEVFPGMPRPTGESVASTGGGPSSWRMALAASAIGAVGPVKKGDGIVPFEAHDRFARRRFGGEHDNVMHDSPAWAKHKRLVGERRERLNIEQSGAEQLRRTAGSATAEVRAEEYEALYQSGERDTGKLPGIRPDLAMSIRRKVVGVPPPSVAVPKLKPWRPDPIDDANMARARANSVRIEAAKERAAGGSAGGGKSDQLLEQLIALQRQNNEILGKLTKQSLPPQIVSGKPPVGDRFTG